MNLGEIVGIVGAATGLVAAYAAALSAKAAASAFRPFVIASPLRVVSNSVQVDAILSNRGPGPALDVRFRGPTTGWSATLGSLGSSEELVWSATDPGLTERWKHEHVDEIAQHVRSGLITIEFSSLDGERWRIIQRGSGGRPKLQQLTPRWRYFWRKIDDSH